jgi:hypothetical protein
MTAEGNERILPLLHGRLGFPKFEDMGQFHVRAMLPAVRDVKSKKYRFATEQDLNEIAGAISEYNKCFEFAPYIEDISDLGYESDLDSDPVHGYSVKHDDHLVAYLMVQDLCKARQNVVISIPFGISLFLTFLNAIGSIVPMYHLPKVGSELKMLYLKDIYYARGYDAALKFLIEKARKYAHENKYSLVTLGLHEKDPFLPTLKKIPGFTFYSRGFVASLNNNHTLINEILKGIPYEDFSLI